MILASGNSARMDSIEPDNWVALESRILSGPFR